MVYKPDLDLSSHIINQEWGIQMELSHSCTINCLNIKQPYTNKNSTSNILKAWSNTVFILVPALSPVL